MRKYLTKKNILSVISVLFFGFVLLIIAFMMVAGIVGFLGLFIKEGDIPAIKMPVAAIIVFLIFGCLTFLTKFSTLVKATFLTVPFAIIMVGSGITFYQWPAISYASGVLITFAALGVLYYKKQPWQYYVAIIFVAIAMLIMAITGTDI